MVSLAKKTMHVRPTYETLVRDTILNPRDKINLPNRTATLLRSTQKLQMFDDESFLDLDEENKRIAAERMQQMEDQQRAAPAALATRPEPAGKEMPMGKRVWLSPPVPTVSGNNRRFSHEWITPSPGRRATPPRLLMKAGNSRCILTSTALG